MELSVQELNELLAVLYESRETYRIFVEERGDPGSDWQEEPEYKSLVSWIERVENAIER